MLANQTIISDRLDRLKLHERASHASGVMPSHVLRRIEELLPIPLLKTCETGCGKSTIIFSARSQHHTVFCLDDRLDDRSSVRYFQDCPITKNDRIELVFGPTQTTLPVYQHKGEYDAVLIDGPHGYPFPELEYLFLYPHLKKGGLLILDDLLVPTIRRLHDFLVEDKMFELIDLISYNNVSDYKNNTAVYRRTNEPTFDPKGDGWWLQQFNVRRRTATRENPWML